MVSPLGIRGAYGLEKLAAGYVVKQNASQILSSLAVTSITLCSVSTLTSNIWGSPPYIDCKGNLHGGARPRASLIHHTRCGRNKAPKSGSEGRFPTYIRVQAESPDIGAFYPGCVQGIVECSGDRTAFAVGQRFAGCGILQLCEAVAAALRIGAKPTGRRNRLWRY